MQFHNKKPLYDYFIFNIHSSTFDTLFTAISTGLHFILKYIRDKKKYYAFDLSSSIYLYSDSWLFEIDSQTGFASVLSRLRGVK